MDAELEELEKVMNVYEEVGGGVGTEFQDQLDNLVTPYRRFMRTEEVGVKRAPFSSAKEEPSRAYFFDDVVLIAAARDGTSSPASIGSMLSTTDAGKRNTLKRFKDKYKVTAWLDLHRCSVREAAAAEALQVTFVTRLREVKKTGTERVLTRVQKLELWFSKPDTMQSVLGDMTDWIDALIELDLRPPPSGDTGSVVSGTSDGRGSMVSGTTDGDGGARRGWAQRKGTLRRHGTLRSNSGAGGDAKSTLRSRKASAASDDGDSVGGLSLSDLESRYKQLNLSTPTGPDASVEYAVEFGEGMMGFRLSSGPAVGVIVGKVAEGSFSDEAGVCIGDRVTEVGGQSVGMDMAWQQVVELIKGKPRPLVIRFERFAGRAVIDDDGKGDAGAAAAAAAPKGARPKNEDEDGGLPRTKSEKRRAWAKHKAQRAHTNNADGDTRLSSLHEVERLYRRGRGADNEEAFDKISDGVFSRMKSDGPQDERTQGAVRLLEEIWASERNFVHALRTLVKEFIIPLRRKQKRVRCRDQDGSLMCEHNLMRSTCSRMSSTADSLLSSQDIRVIFLNVETLVKVNSELLAQMESDLLKLADASAAPAVAEVAAVYNPAFRRIMPFIKLYGVYCHQYPAAIDYLLLLRTNEAEVNDAVTDRERKANATLSSLLITPVQRVCRYPLLFKELLKIMRNLGDKALAEPMVELQKTIGVVEAVADDVNRLVGDSENSENMLDVYNELGGGAVVAWLIEPSRKFVTKVSVLMHEPPYNTEAKLHVLYLCTDLLLLGKPSSGSRFGSLKKTGGKGGASRAVSLRRAFGNSMASRASGAKGNGHGSRASGTRKSNSLHRSGTRGTGGGIQVKLVKTIELKSVKAALIAEPDDQECFGVELKYVERSIEAPPKRGAKAGGSGKQVTTINKMRIWLPSQQEQQQVFEDITGAVAELKRLQAEHKKAQMTVGASKARAQRTWKKKAGLPEA